jgi:hypothetical protein
MPEVEKSDIGKYTVQTGDDASLIAAKVYGDRHQVRKVLDANPTSSYEVGDVIDIPGFTGILVTARTGEQFPSLHRRAFNNPAASAGALPEFRKWNGVKEVQPGRIVFFVDMRRKSYAY